MYLNEILTQMQYNILNENGGLQHKCDKQNECNTTVNFILDKDVFASQNRSQFCS